MNELTPCLTLETADEAATRAFGERLGRLLAPGDVVCLAGELGAGKTMLAQGIAAGLGVDEPVSSPTFALVQEYAGRAPIYHLDLYRLASLDELIDLGFPELWHAGGVILIEWPERIAPALPPDRLEIHLATHPSGRRLTLAAHGRRASRVLADIEGALNHLRTQDTRKELSADDADGRR
jgi:tRNA threonylcarbamoyladenosine biosynthesis protein TsaE